MKQLITSKKVVGLLAVLMMASCGGEAVPPVDAAQVIGLIRQDANAIADNPNITNELSLIDVQGRTNADPARGDFFSDVGAAQGLAQPQPVIIEDLSTSIPIEEPVIVDQTPVAVAPLVAAPRSKSPKAPVKRSYLNTFLKLGTDKNGQRVSPRLPKKITTVIEAGQAAYIDIFLYAIPAGMRLVMNANTLIGFAKNFDVVNGQAQFTRYWNTSNTQGRFLKKGNYNIYLSYTYRDVNGRTLGTGGRYWGGSRPMVVLVE